MRGDIAQWQSIRLQIERSPVQLRLSPVRLLPLCCQRAAACRVTSLALNCFPSASALGICSRHLQQQQQQQSRLRRGKGVRRPGIEPGSQEWESCMIPLHQRRVNWRCRGLNPGPFTCEANALPLSHIPWPIWTSAEKALTGPATSRFLARKATATQLQTLPHSPLHSA